MSGKDKVKSRLRTATLNLLTGKGAEREADIAPQVLETLRKIHDEPEILGDVAKLYKAHLKQYPEEREVATKGLHGKQISFTYPEDEELFVENLASLFTTRVTFSEISRSQMKASYVAQIKRVEQLLKYMGNPKIGMNYPLGKIYFDNWLKIRVDIEPTKTIHQMGGMDTALVNYNKRLREGIENISNLPQGGGATKEQKVLSDSFYIITEAIFELTGKTRTTIVQRLFEDIHGLYLGRNFGDIHRYKP